MGDRLGARRVSGNCVARATSRPREGALWVAMVQKVLSRARVGVLVACGCAGAVMTAPRARCEHCRPCRQLFRRRARARAAAKARFRLLDAAGALCSGTGVRETRLRCFGAAQCQVRRLKVFKFLRQDDAAEVRGDAAGLPRACKPGALPGGLRSPVRHRRDVNLSARNPHGSAASGARLSKTYTQISPPPAHLKKRRRGGRPCRAGCRCGRSPGSRPGPRDVEPTSAALARTAAARRRRRCRA